MMRNYKLWRRMKVVANSVVDKPFAHPCNPPETFDCVALVKYVYDELDWSFPWAEIVEACGDPSLVDLGWWKDETQPNYFEIAVKIACDEIKPTQLYAGDLVLFRLTHPDRPTHAAVSVDGSQFVHVIADGKVQCPRLIGLYEKRMYGAYRIKKEYRL